MRRGLAGVLFFVAAVCLALAARPGIRQTLSKERSGLTETNYDGVI